MTAAALRGYLEELRDRGLIEEVTGRSSFRLFTLWIGGGEAKAFPTPIQGAYASRARRAS